MKKLVTLLLSLTMVMSLSPAWIFAADESAPADTSQEVTNEQTDAVQEDLEESSEEQPAIDNDGEDLMSIATEEGGSEEEVFCSLEEEIKGDISPILTGDSYIILTKGECLNDYEQFEQYQEDGNCPYVVDSVQVKSGANTGIVTITNNEDDDDDGVNDWKINGTAAGSTTLVVTYTLGEGTNTKTITFEIDDVEVKDAIYDLGFEQTINGNATESYYFLPGEKFTLKAFPSCEAMFDNQDGSLCRDKKVSGDDFWDDYKILFTSTDEELTLTPDYDTNSCEVAIKQTAEDEAGCGVTVSIVDIDNTSNVFYSQEFSFWVSYTAQRMEVTGLSRQINKDEPVEVTAASYQLDYNEQSHQISKAEIDNVEYTWDYNENNFTVEDLTSNSWRITRISNSWASLEIDASWADDGGASLYYTYDAISTDEEGDPEEGDPEEDVWCDLENTIEDSISPILKGDAYIIEKEGETYNEYEQFSSDPFDCPYVVNNVSVKSGANTGIVTITSNEDYDHDGVNDWEIEGTTAGNTTLVINYTLGEGNNTKTIDFEVDVEVKEAIYDVSVQATIGGNITPDCNYLPTETFTLQALPSCECYVNDFDGSTNRVSKKYGDTDFWEDYRFEFSSDNENLELDVNSTKCDITVAEDAEEQEASIYIAVIDKETSEEVSYTTYELYITGGTHRMVVSGLPREMAKGESADVTAKVFWMDYNNENHTISQNEVAGATYSWDYDDEDFTVEDLTSSSWRITRISNNWASLDLEAEWSDEWSASGGTSLYQTYDAIDLDITELELEDNDSLFAGSAFQLGIAEDSVMDFEDLEYDDYKWILSYWDDETDDSVEIPSKYYKQDTMSFSITAANSKSLASYLGVTDEYDDQYISVDVYYYLDGEEVAHGNSGFDLWTPYVGLTVGGQEEILVGETAYFVYKDSSVYIHNNDHPDGDNLDATVTGVSVEKGKTSYVSVVKGPEGWSLKGLKAYSKPIKITVSYSYKDDNGKTVKDSDVYTVTVVKERYSVYPEYENNSSEMLYGATKKINAVCEHEYYDSTIKDVVSESVDGINWTMQLDRDSSSEVTTFIELSEGDWKYQITASPYTGGSEEEEDGYGEVSDYYTLTAEKNGKVLGYTDFCIYVEKEYYEIRQNMDCIELTNIDENGYSASDLATVYYFDATHTSGIVADGTNGTENYMSNLKLDECEDVFAFVDDEDGKLYLKQSSNIVQALKDGYDGFWIDIVVEDTDPEEEFTSYDLWNEFTFGIHCNHDTTAHALDQAGPDKHGWEAYWECNTCGRLYSDAGCTTQIDEPVMIPAVKSIKLEKTSFEYTGSAIEPSAVILDANKNQLVEGTDYTISYTDNVDVTNNACAEITFIGNYSGSSTLEFAITPAAQKVSPTIVIDNENSSNPGVLYVSKNTAKVECNRDGESAANENVGAIKTIAAADKKSKSYATVAKVGENWIITPKASGTATFKVTLEASGNYKETTGTLKVTVVTPTKISGLTLNSTSMQYNAGNECKPGVKSVTYKVGKKTYTLDPSLYTVDYSNNINVGKKAVAKVTVNSDCFDYYGTISKNFTITKANQTMGILFDDNWGKVQNGNYLEAYIGQYTDTPYIQVYRDEGVSVGTITVKSSNTKIVKVVKVSEDNYNLVIGTKTGTAKITVTAAGNGNYNKATKTYTIKVANPVKITSSMISFMDDNYSDGSIAYDGTSKEISEDAVIVKNGNTILDNRAYEVTVDPAGATDIGTVKVTVRVKDVDDQETQGCLNEQVYGFVEGSSATKTYNIVLATMATPELIQGSKSFTASWTKPTPETAVSGYELRYSLKSTMASSKTVKIGSGDTLTTTVKKLSAKKTYYVQVRAYTTIGKTKYYSDWSEKATVVTK